MNRNLTTAAAAAFSLVLSAAAVQAAAPAGRAPTGGDDVVSLRGEEPTGPARPTPRGPDGKPDLTGYWKSVREPGKPGGNLGKDQPGFKLPFTPAGQAALQHNYTKTVDPEALCILGGIPRHNGSGLPFEILAHPNRVAFLYWYTTYRLVPVGADLKHEADPEPKFFGNAVSKWDGDTLVIDTVGFKDTQIWLDENANPQSDAMHVVERWTRPDYDHIRLEMTLEDPKFYTKPFTFGRTWVLGKPGEGLNEYACNENNIDREHLGPGPGEIRADGTRGYPVGVELPANPPGPEAYETAPAKPAAKPRRK